MERALGERLPEEVGGGHGVLDREVDPDARDRRHGVGGVADAEHARRSPPPEPVHGDRQRLDVVPRGERVGPVCEDRRCARDGLAEGVEASGADGVGLAFGDDVAALVVAGAREHHEDAARVEGPERGLGVVGVARKAHPEHVHRRAEVVGAKACEVADGGRAAVGADDEVGLDAEWTARRFCFDARDAAVGVAQQARHLGLHAEVEARVPAADALEHVEEVPLRHERHELHVGGQVRKVPDVDRLPADLAADFAQFLVGPCEEVLERAEIVQDLERGRVDGVAAEVAEEVAVLFDDDDGDACSGEEHAEHHPGGTAADDAAGCVDGHGSRPRRDVQVGLTGGHSRKGRARGRGRAASRRGRRPGRWAARVAPQNRAMEGSLRAAQVPRTGGPE